MRLVFAGTPSFAAAALAAVLETQHQVVAVLTQPDRPAGRGLMLRPSEVKTLAIARGIPVRQPSSLKDVHEQDALRALAPDLMIVAAYGLILPQAVLDIPRLGAINIHASLLPRWRGAAPIQRAILAGDKETGICIMRMEAGLDTGPVLLAQSLPIAVDDTAGSLHDKLAALGAQMVKEIIDPLERGACKSTPQQAELATYAAKLSKEEGRLNWQSQAELLHRQVRAFNPLPGASTTLRTTEIKIWKTELLSQVSGDAGKVLDVDSTGPLVACGCGGAVRLLELQKSGAKRMTARDFLRGFSISPGEIFSS